MASKDEEEIIHIRIKTKFKHKLEKEADSGHRSFSKHCAMILENHLQPHTNEVSG